MVRRLGTLNPKPAYHTETQLWPVEYWARASIPNDPTHSYLLSKVKDGGDAGPCFSVSTKLPYGSSAEETVVSFCCASPTGGSAGFFVTMAPAFQCQNGHHGSI